jgi:transcriptional regulator with XRE-family HTH domain
MISELSETVDDWERRLGVDIRALRQRKRFTQAELAELANVSSSAIKYLEAGKGSSLSTLVRVARALDREEWLTSLLPPKPSVSPMATLRQQRLAQQRGPARVRHSKSDRPPA